MTIKFHRMPKGLQAGITLKNDQKPEQFNMALHSCQDPQAVLENRHSLADTLHIPLSRFVFAQQTHSANFKKITEADCGKGALQLVDAIQDTDAFYTLEKNIVLTSMTADCVPVTFYSEEAGLIGTIHSGWSGTVKEISYLLFKHLTEQENVDATTLHAHIGYSICADKFEVDADVADQFKALGYAEPFITFNSSTTKYHIDNQLVVKTQCEMAGIPAENITIDRECTYELAEGFSYRQDRQCGRHVSFIVQLEEKNDVEKSN